MHDKLKTILLLLTTLLVLQTTQSSGQTGGADAQFTTDGTDSCIRCHGGERMTVIAETAHGNVEDPHAPFAKQGCESCHGPGSLHVSRARGGAGFPALIRFGDDENSAQQKAACLSLQARRRPFCQHQSEPWTALDPLLALGGFASFVEALASLDQTELDICMPRKPAVFAVADPTNQHFRTTLKTTPSLVPVIVVMLTFFTKVLK